MFSQPTTEYEPNDFCLGPITHEFKFIITFYDSGVTFELNSQLVKFVITSCIEYKQSPPLDSVSKSLMIKSNTKGLDERAPVTGHNTDA